MIVLLPLIFIVLSGSVVVCIIAFTVSTIGIKHYEMLPLSFIGLVIGIISMCIHVHLLTQMLGLYHV